MHQCLANAAQSGYVFALLSWTDDGFRVAPVGEMTSAAIDLMTRARALSNRAITFSIPLAATKGATDQLAPRLRDNYPLRPTGLLTFYSVLQPIQGFSPFNSLWLTFNNIRIFSCHNLGWNQRTFLHLNSSNWSNAHYIIKPRHWIRATDTWLWQLASCFVRMMLILRKPECLWWKKKIKLTGNHITLCL